MKLSFAISIQETDFGYITKNMKWQVSMKLLADLGYDGVELGIRNPETVDKVLLEKVLNKYRLQLSAIGTGQAYIDDGLSLSTLNTNLREKAIKKIKNHIDLANVFGTQVIIGLIRGRKDHQANLSQRYKNRLLNSIRRICDYAASKDVTITIEPLNRYETNFLNNINETLIFVRQIKYKKLKVLLDTFHMNIEERNLIDPIRKAREYLSHVHLADNNRRCPGEGSINFKQILEYLKEIGYKGYVSGEMLPLPSAEYCIKNFFRTIKPYIGG
jgi:sugar phosphate isomerase/epimerase